MLKQFYEEVRAKRQAAERDAERRELLEFYKRCKHIPQPPKCPLCLNPMMEGDEQYVYNKCGHRVCACAVSVGSRTKRKRDAWATQCVTCKRDRQVRIRLE